MSEKAQNSLDKNINFKILTIAIFAGFLVFGFSENIKGPAIPRIQSDFSLTEFHIGLLLSLNSLGYLLACAYTGWLVKRLGIKTATISSFVVMALAGVLIYFSPNYLTFAGSYFVMYLGNGMLEISLGVMAATIFTRNTGTMMNLSHFFYGLSSMIAPLLSTGLMAATFRQHNIGWRGMYLIVLSFSLLPILPVLMGKYPRQSQEDSHGPSLWDFAKNPIAWLIVFILSFAVVAEMAVGGWLVNFLEKSYDFHPTTAAGVLTGFFFCFMSARLLFGPIIDRLGFVKSICIAALFSGSSILLSLWIGRPAVFLLAAAGFGVAPVYPTVMALISKLFKDSVSTAMTFVLTVMGTAMVGGNLLVGGVVDLFKILYMESVGAEAAVKIAYKAGYAFIGLCCLICFGGTLLLYKKLKKANSLY